MPALDARSRRLLAVLLVVLAAVVAARWIRKGIRGNDFGAYHAAARAVLEGEDVYEVRSAKGREYLYPPTLAILVAPLGWLPEAAASVVWNGLKILLLWVLFRELARLLPPDAGGGSWRRLALAALVVAAPLNNEMSNGQADLVTVLALALMAAGLARGRPVRAGLALALGIAVKVTPALLGLWLLWRRAWLAAASCAAGTLALVLLLPALAWGPRGAVEANLRWARLVAGPRSGVESTVPVVEETAPFVHGHSLRPVLHHWLTPSSVDHEKTVLANPVSLPTPAVEWLYRGLGLLLVLAAGAVLGRGGCPRDGPRLLGEVGLVGAVMVLVAPLSRVAHYCVVLLAAAATAGQWGHSRRRGWLVVLGIAALLFDGPMWFVPRDVKMRLLGLGAPALATLLLGTALAVALRRGVYAAGPAPSPRSPPG